MYYVVQENHQPTFNDKCISDSEDAVKLANHLHRVTGNHYEVVSTELFYSTYDPSKSFVVRFARMKRAKAEAENASA